ncbi:MAG TPA: hypothetical protein VK137_13900, partial [Planctomycetaceae bacterium]|nr:hypothetical protein [Planctomycetaceae bacterium]
MSLGLRWRWRCGCVFVLTAIWSASAFAQYGGYGASSGLSAVESQINSHLHALEKTMESAHKELTAGRKQLTQSEADFQKKSHEYTALRQQVRKEADTKPELVRARQQVTETERDFHDARSRVIKRLLTTKDYQSATEQKQSLSERLKALTADDPKETRANLAKQSAEATVSLSSLEDAALTADPDAKKAQKRFRDAEQDLATLVHQRDDAIAKDSRLSSAKTAFERARDEHNAAQRQFAQAQAAATQADRAYQTLMSDKLMVSQQRAQQHRANSGWGYRYGGYGRGRSRQHFFPGPLGGAGRIIMPPVIIQTP